MTLRLALFLFLAISCQAQFLATPSSLRFPDYSQPNPGTATLQVNSGYNVPFTAQPATQWGGAWLTATVINNGAAVQVTASPAGLLPGTYYGSVTLVSPRGLWPSLVVPVTLVVGPGVASVSRGSVNLSSPYSQPIKLSSPSPVPYTVTVSTSSGGNWLSCSPLSGTAPATLTPVYNYINAPPPGNHFGAITIHIAGQPDIVVPVLLVIPTNQKGTAADSRPDTLAFQQIAGATPTAAQDATFSTSPGLSVVTEVLTPPGITPWLAATSPATTTLATVVHAAIKPNNLPPGEYASWVLLKIPSGPPAVLLVTLSVANAAATLSTSSSSVAVALKPGSGPAVMDFSLMTASPGPYTTMVNAVSQGVTWLSVSPAQGATTPTGTQNAATLQLTVSPAGLPVGSYSGTIAFTSGGATATVTVTLTILEPVHPDVFPRSLFVPQQAGAASPPAQLIHVNTEGGSGPLAVSQDAESRDWLHVETTSPTAPGIVVVWVTAEHLPPNAYRQGYVTIEVAGLPVSFIVFMRVENSPTAAITPYASTLRYQPGGSAPAVQSLNLELTPSGPPTNVYLSNENVVTGYPWIQNVGQVAAPSKITAQINLGDVAQGFTYGWPSLYPGGNLADYQWLVRTYVAPGPLLYSPSQSIDLSPGSQQVVTVSSTGTAFPLQAVAVNGTGGSWLNVATATPGGGFRLTTNDPGLPPGTYFAAIAVDTVPAGQAGYAPLMIPVRYTVPSPMVLSPTSANFAFNGAQRGPSSRRIAITGVPAGSIAVAVNPLSGSGWLSASIDRTTNPPSLLVTADARALNSGSYNGSITITAANGLRQAVSVLANVDPGPMVASPAMLSFTAAANGTVAPQQVSLSASGFAILTNITTDASWLTAAPGYTNLPATLTVNVSTAGLRPGVYSGRLVLTATNPSLQTVILVQLTVPGQAGCVYTVAPPATLSATAQTLAITVTTSPGCGWSADVVQNQWLTAATSTGVGTGNALFNVTSNTGSWRVAQLRIAGQTITVQQAPATAAQTTGLRFVSMAPCRVMETRAEYNFQGRTGPFAPPYLRTAETRTLPLRSSNVCSIPSDAKAYVLNVTAVPRGPLDFVTLWPSGQPRPTYWTLRSPDGQIVANSAIVQAGTNGAIDLYTSNDTDLILDISGYFTDAPAALAFYPLTPCRLVDTRVQYRPQAGPFGPPSLTAQASRRIPVRTSTACPVPPQAAAYALTLTVAPPGPLQYLTAWPSGGPQPNVSTINSPAGRTLANSVIVPAGVDGSIDVFAYNATDLIIDITGYFAPDDSQNGLLYFPVTQCRASDTTSAGFSGDLGRPFYADGAARTLAIPFSSCGGIPATARAYALTATAMPFDAMPFLTLWPTGQPQPNASILNAFEGQTATNAAIIAAGANGSIDLFTYRRTDVVLDLSGYFAR